MLWLVSKVLVIAGACILLAALIPLRRLVAQLMPGKVLRRWYVLGALTALFVVGYLGYLVAYWGAPAGFAGLLVPGVFFFGAVFVLLVFRLSLDTACDVKRVLLLEHENVSDPLMGIHNRRYLDRQLAQELARAQRYGLPLSLAMIDIDHFKEINDIHGHQSGDRALIELGAMIRRCIRVTDVLARYGGEELVVLATDTPLREAAELAERIRKRVESQPVVLPDPAQSEGGIRVTVSVGLASLSNGIDTAEALISCADKALYEAKRAGRNRVEVFEE